MSCNMFKGLLLLLPRPNDLLYLEEKIGLASAEHFKARMEKLKSYLSRREEKCIAIVVHRDVIESLVGGESPANCDFATLTL